MSIVDPGRPSTPKFISVVCPCGRGLRAAAELAGQEIQCWECHRMVPVPIPRSRERSVRVVTEGFNDLLEIRWVLAAGVAAAVLTGVLSVRGIGHSLGALVLVIGALGYGELIRQCGIDFWDFDDWKKPATLASRVGMAVLFGLALAAPLLLSRGPFGRPLRFQTLGVFLALVGSILLPLAMFLTFARDDAGPLGWRVGWHVIVRHPVATAIALSLIPISVVLAECLLFVVSSWQGMFPFLVLDLFAGSEYYAKLYKIPMFGNYTKGEFPDSRFFQLYARRLHQGFSLIGTLPASLSKQTNVLASPWTLQLDDIGYLRMRAFYSLISSMLILFFLALQARLLGAISTLESKRSL